MRSIVLIAALALFLCAISYSLGAGVYYDGGGVVYGPFSETQMRTWLEEGYFDRNTPVSFHSDLYPAFPLANLFPAPRGYRPLLRPSIAAAVKYMKKVTLSIASSKSKVAGGDADLDRHHPKLHEAHRKVDRATISDWTEAGNENFDRDALSRPSRALDGSDSEPCLTGEPHEYPADQSEEAQPQDYKEGDFQVPVQDFELPPKPWNREQEITRWSPSLESPARTSLRPIRAVRWVVWHFLTFLLPPTLRTISGELGVMKLLAVVVLGILIQFSQLLCVGAAVVSVLAASARLSSPIPPVSAFPGAKLDVFLPRIAQQLRCTGTSRSFWGCGVEVARAVWESAVMHGAGSSAAQHVRTALAALAVHAVTGHVFTPRLRRGLSCCSDEDEWLRGATCSFTRSVGVVVVSFAALVGRSPISALVPVECRSVWSLSLATYAVTLLHGVVQAYAKPPADGIVWRRLTLFLPLYLLGWTASWVAYRDCTFEIVPSAPPTAQAAALLFGHVAPLWLSAQLLLNEMG